MEVALIPEPLKWLVLAIVLLCISYFLVPEEKEQPKGRNLEREHALGAHRETPAWGCKICSANQ